MNPEAIKFKDIAHLYVGCEVYSRNNKGGITKLFYVDLYNNVKLQCWTDKNTFILMNDVLTPIPNIHPVIMKPILRPLWDMKIEEGAYCLQQTFFPHVEYPISNFRLKLVGKEEMPKNPRISIDNDWYNNNLTFGNDTGSIWSCDNVSENVKIRASVFAYLIKQGFDMFGLIASGEAIASTDLEMDLKET